MTATIRPAQKPLQLFKSLSASLAIIAPCLATMLMLRDSRLPQDFPILFSCLILIVMSVNFGTAIMIEPYRKDFSRLTPSALLSASGVILISAIAAAVTSFLNSGISFSYAYVAPLVIASLALIYLTIFTERNIVMKAYLGLNAIALLFLWMLGTSGNFTLPF